MQKIREEQNAAFVQHKSASHPEHSAQNFPPTHKLIWLIKPQEFARISRSSKTQKRSCFFWCATKTYYRIQQQEKIYFFSSQLFCTSKLKRLATSPSTLSSHLNIYTIQQYCTLYNMVYHCEPCHYLLFFTVSVRPVTAHQPLLYFSMLFCFFVFTTCIISFIKGSMSRYFLPLFFSMIQTNLGP